MGLVSFFLGIIGFGFGIPIGLLVGYFLFIYSESTEITEPIIRPVNEFDTSSLLDILPEIPLWVKQPDYDRIDWFNKFVSDIWPHLDKAVCGVIKSNLKPMFAEYVGKYHLKSIDFKSLTLGTLPPAIHGIKVCDTNENEVILEPAVRWAGNPDITLALKFFSLQITVQLVDVQIRAAPRIVLKPLVPAFPCFASVAVSLMEKPDVDFGLKLVGGDIMAIPGLYQFIQETIRKQIAALYLWPQTLEIPILDGSVGATKKPMGILHVKVVRAIKLLKMDLFGASDPYVQLSLSGERLPAKKTTIKMKNLNPEWNEDFKLTVRDPQSQVLQLHVYDWEKVGTHDKLGMQTVPLRSITPNETKEFTLDLVKNTNPNDPQNQKWRGQLVVELTFNLFRDDSKRFSVSFDNHVRNESDVGVSTEFASLGAGLLLVTVQRAEDVEGKHHSNPYALIIFRGEQKKTKIIRKSRDPCWNEEFQFVLEEAPLKEKIHIEVKSKRSGLRLRPKESLGYVDINLDDVVYNGRMKEKYHLINSKNGVVHVEMRWKAI
ncbi:synaptotagmin-3 [Melia azedarach]|uniref:Synaptotagmin-3 n=1 Tax=Melia azedarach TaxID=155640 RepID=A0ACC1X0C7_MELAZ|nr:synaptotagmin-3 [Melia azedarach]